MRIPYMFDNRNNVNNPAIFNFKKCGMEFRNARLDYMMGNKEEDKLEKVEGDKILRTMLGLKDIMPEINSTTID